MPYCGVRFITREDRWEDGSLDGDAVLTESLLTLSSGASFPASGTWESPPFILPAIDRIGSSEVVWEATLPEGSSATVSASLDSGSSWTTVTLGGSIPGLAGYGESKQVLLRVGLSAPDAAHLPEISDLTLTVRSVLTPVTQLGTILLEILFGQQAPELPENVKVALFTGERSEGFQSIPATHLSTPPEAWLPASRRAKRPVADLVFSGGGGPDVWISGIGVFGTFSSETREIAFSEFPAFDFRSGETLTLPAESFYVRIANPVLI